METLTDTDARDRADMADLCAGREVALDRLMERHAPAVLRFLTHLVGNADDARDLAQETFVRLYRARDRFRPAARFTPWLFTLAANLGRNHLRWKARHPAISLDAATGPAGQPLGADLPAHTPDPHAAAAAAEQVVAVRNAIAELPPHLREALLLCVWEDLSVADAARALGASTKSVESLLYRARRALRDRLAARR